MAGGKSFTRPTLSVSPRYTSSIYCSRLKKQPRMVMFAPETMWSWISPANGWPSYKSKQVREGQIKKKKTKKNRRHILILNPVLGSHPLATALLTSPCCPVTATPSQCLGLPSWEQTASQSTRPGLPDRLPPLLFAHCSISKVLQTPAGPLAFSP